jgi:hypothetical protein
VKLGRSRFGRTIPVVFFLVFAESAICAQAPQTASVLLPQNASAPAKFGATALSESLTRKGLQGKVATFSNRRHIL